MEYTDELKNLMTNDLTFRESFINMFINYLLMYVDIEQDLNLLYDELSKDKNEELKKKYSEFCKKLNVDENDVNIKNEVKEKLSNREYLKDFEEILIILYKVFFSLNFENNEGPTIESITNLSISLYEKDNNFKEKFKKVMNLQ